MLLIIADIMQHGLYANIIIYLFIYFMYTVCAMPRFISLAALPAFLVSISRTSLGLHLAQYQHWLEKINLVGKNLMETYKITLQKQILSVHH